MQPEYRITEKLKNPDRKKGGYYIHKIAIV